MHVKQDFYSPNPHSCFILGSTVYPFSSYIFLWSFTANTHTTTIPSCRQRSSTAPYHRAGAATRGLDAVTTMSVSAGVFLFGQHRQDCVVEAYGRLPDEPGPRHHPSHHSPPQLPLLPGSLLPHPSPQVVWSHIKYSLIMYPLPSFLW